MNTTLRPESTVSPEPPRPPDSPAEQPMSRAQKAWRGILIVVVLGALLAMFFKVDVTAPINAAFHHAFPIFGGAPDPQGTPTVGGPMPSSSPSIGDSDLASAVNDLHDKTAPQASQSPGPRSVVPQAPQVNGSAAKAGLTNGTPTSNPAAVADYNAAQSELAQANALNPNANSPQMNPFSGGGTQGDMQSLPTAPTPGPPVVQTPPPSLVNPAAAQMFGATQGQMAGSTPETVQGIGVAQQASFLTGGNGPGGGGVSAYTHGQVEAAHSNDEIWPGDPIDCVIKNTVQTDLPGIAIGVVTRDVKSHLPPYHLLIPALTQFWGPYDALVGSGQTRMQFRWDEMVFPNGATLPLESVQAQDTQGTAGVAADVDNHVGKVYTSTIVGILASALGGVTAARASLQTNPSYGSLVGISAGQAVSQNFSQQASAAAALPPTLAVRSGTPCQISFAAIQVLPPYAESANRYASPKIRSGAAPSSGDGGTPTSLIP